MNQIYPPISPLNELCGKQKAVAGKSYRWTSFCMRIPADGGVLFFHTLLGEMLLLTSEEAENALFDESISGELKRRWFLVPESFDDVQFSDQCREAAFLMLPQPEPGIDSFTIFTTTDCNARCFYCYEMGGSRLKMTEQTARDAASYILKVSRGKKLDLKWFGGEPLYNAAAIDTIIQSIRAAGREFTSTMVSNSYLFDQAMVQKAVSEWNLKTVQVTLDGTESVYNRTKAFIYKDDGSPFRRVMEAVELLLKAGIEVLIRMNVDHANAEDLMSLAEILFARFGRWKNFRVYADLLFDRCCKHKFPDMQTELESLTTLNDKLSSLGVLKILPLDRQIQQGYCMADNDAAVTILPDGHLGKCDLYPEDHFAGNIYSEELDQNTLREFKVLRQPVESCRSCVHYPLCNVPVLCADGGPCTELYRALKLDNLQRRVLESYRKSKENNRETEETVPAVENC